MCFFFHFEVRCKSFLSNPFFYCYDVIFMSDVSIFCIHMLITLYMLIYANESLEQMFVGFYEMWGLWVSCLTLPYGQSNSAFYTISFFFIFVDKVWVRFKLIHKSLIFQTIMLQSFIIHRFYRLGRLNSLSSASVSLSLFNTNNPLSTVPVDLFNISIQYFSFQSWN